MSTTENKEPEKETFWLKLLDLPWRKMLIVLSFLLAGYVCYLTFGSCAVIKNCQHGNGSISNAVNQTVKDSVGVNTNINPFK